MDCTVEKGKTLDSEKTKTSRSKGSSQNVKMLYRKKSVSRIIHQLSRVVSFLRLAL
jgi:hypothetical protein